nr:ribonuclease H-like domain-containing protein [Tanacetum cinerariifolium]
VTNDVPHTKVNRPRPAKTVVTKPHSPPRRTINHSSSPKPSNFPPKVTTVKAPKVNVVKGVQGNWTLTFLFLMQGNPQHDLNDKGVIHSGCVRYMTGNMSYLFDFEAIKGGYVDLKNIVPTRDLTCLFAKAILDEFNVWHRRLGHINFKTMNKQVKGNLVRGLPLKVFENNHTCVACKKGKQHRALVRPSLSVLLANPYKGYTWTYLDQPL